MAYVTIEDRVDRLEAMFGQFLTELAVSSKRAEERERVAEARHREAEERNRQAEQRMGRFEEEMRAFKIEMGEFKDEMLEFKDEMGEFKDEMRQFKRESQKAWGDLANRLGTIVEDILAPNLRRLAVEHFKFPTIEDFMVRRERRHPVRGGMASEFDTLVAGPDALILGEAKSKPSVESADEFAAKAREFFEFFPEYRGRKLIPVFGSWSIPDRVLERLTALGIYGMRMGEDTMELANAAVLEARQ